MAVQPYEVPDWVKAIILLDPTDIWGKVVGIGLSELIACLTHGKRFDHRGSIFYLESFENGLNHAYSTLAGSLAAVGITSAESRHGGLSAVLTGGSNGSRYAALSWPFYQTPVGKVGFEASFRILPDIQYLVMQIAWYDGTEVHYGNLRYNHDNGDFEYLDSAGVYQTLQAGDALRKSAGLFHTVKFVVDVENDLYTRALIRAAEVDMSSYALRVATDPFAAHLLFTVFLHSHSGDNDQAYLDGLVMTQNEPA